MADIAAIFHWTLSDMAALSLPELDAVWDAVKREAEARP